jgi:WD40 repeat protein/DNA-binding SARP family transcriptional activator
VVSLPGCRPSPRNASHGGHDQARFVSADAAGNLATELPRPEISVKPTDYAPSKGCNMIEFRALGSLAVVVDGQEMSIGGPRQRRLLAMLLIHHDDVVSVDRLADAVFAGEPTDAARTTMRSYIARIRRVIGPGSPTVSLVTRAPGYSLQTAADVFDVATFESLLEDGRRQHTSGDAAVAIATLRSALDLWAGDAYAEFADEEWAYPEAQRLEELRLAAFEWLVQAELACGRATESVALLDQLVTDHPLREAFRSLQMLALYRAGRQVDALRAFRSYRDTLRDEIGLEPSPGLVDLQRRILEHDESLELGESAGEPLRGYRLGRRLGTGPNGTMYLASVPGEVHERTISILTDPVVDDAQFVRSFEMNAQRIASLHHPGVVALHDYWREPGTAYVVGRGLATSTLRDRLERGPMRHDEIVSLVTRVGGGLAEAASRGIGHGWITLDNIVESDGGYAITNFVVCPSGPDNDISDLVTVLRTCLDGSGVSLGDAVRDEVTAVLEYPHSTITDLVDALQRALAATVDTPLAAPPNPFKGLRAFDETDSAEFHGRELLVGELVERVHAEAGGALTLVVGASGSGKSSVVRAGVIPEIRNGALAADDRWFVTTMMPGGSPFKELAEALRRIAVSELDGLDGALRDGTLGLDDAARAILPPCGRLLLVIDQFEELFTLNTVEEQSAFLGVLTDAIDTSDGVVHVLATMRADFYDRPLAFQRFGAFVGPATVVVAAMSPSELESAIVRPVVAHGATAEPALVAELVAAVADQAAALPALQFTLYELAERRPDRCLTLDAYRELGGVDRAIASRADRLYLSLDDHGRALVRSVFEQLVVIDVESEATGRRSARADLVALGDADAVHDMIEHWTAARLLSGDHDPRTRVPTVQVAHEALLRSWPRLREWIVEDRNLIVEAHHRREAAAAWELVERDEGALYRGARLDRALELTGGDHDRLPPVEREFLDASASLRAREENEAHARIAQQARANRRLRIQLGIIAVALVAALTVGFVAVDQRGEARSERDAADVARRTATARELAAAADANIDVDPERAIHLALRAVDITRAVDGTVLPAAVDALHRSVTTSRVLVNVPGVGGRLDWHPTSDRFVTEGPEESGIVDIRSATTGESIATWRGDDVDINEVRYSKDGTMLAVAGDDGVLKVFDPETGALISSVAGTGPVWSLSFDDGGNLLLAQWTDEQVIRLVDPTTGTVLGEVPSSVQHLELSPDGSSVAVANFDGVGGVTIVDLATQQPTATVATEGWVLEARWSPDGQYVALVADDGIVRIIEAATGEPVAAASGQHFLIAVEWSPAGTALATGSNDGSAQIWDFDGSLLVERQHVQVQDLANGVPGLAFSPDGTRLAIGDWAITSTKIVDITPLGGAEIANLVAEPYHGVAFAGDEVVVADPDGVVQAVDVSPGADRSSRLVGDVASIRPGFVLDDSRRQVAVLVDDRDGRIEVRDTATGEVLVDHDVSDGSFVETMAWHPDGRHLAYAQATDQWANTEIVVIDATGAVVASKELEGLYVSSISFSPDGARLAWNQNRRLRADPLVDSIAIWDWRAAEDVGRIEASVTNVEFDPSGRFLAATRFNDGRAEVFDATTYEPIVTLSGSTTQHLQLAFSADGSKLATAGADGIVRIWDPVTGEEQMVLRTPKAARNVAFDETGERLASLDGSGVARVWALDLETLVEVAEGRLTRALTIEECERYLLSECPN